MLEKKKSLGGSYKLHLCLKLFIRISHMTAPNDKEPEAVLPSAGRAELELLGEQDSGLQFKL